MPENVGDRTRGEPGKARSGPRRFRCPVDWLAVAEQGTRFKTRRATVGLSPFRLPPSAFYWSYHTASPTSSSCWVKNSRWSLIPLK